MICFAHYIEPDFHGSFFGFAYYDSKINKFVNEDGVELDWLESVHFDKRKAILLLFNFDPFTGEKINIQHLKNKLKTM